MYLWIGLEIEEKEKNKIRTYCKKVNKAKVNEQSFTLPQHISLKTSFFLLINVSYSWSQYQFQCCINWFIPIFACKITKNI